MSSASDFERLGPEDDGTARLNVPVLLFALVPQVITFLAVLGTIPLEGLGAVACAVLGVLTIAAYRQWATRVAAQKGYERSETLHRLMSVAIVTSILLLVLVLVPYALDRATGACACA